MIINYIILMGACVSAVNQKSHKGFEAGRSTQTLEERKKLALETKWEEVPETAAMTNAERFELHMPMSRLHIEEWETMVNRDTKDKYVSIDDLIDSLTGKVDPKLYCEDSQFLKVLKDCEILRASQIEKEGSKLEVSVLLSKQALLTWGIQICKGGNKFKSRVLYDTL